jgi:energy-coupling factor transporter ATP-binding protein EcfA2
MLILQEILNWSQTLPAWQSDAIARLFAKEVLSDADLDDLFALMKMEHGIPDPKGRAANKLSAEQIPAQALPNTHVRLIALKNLRHVNRIADNQRLSFSPSGLTVIYGDNGSGKSGYSRVLKRACRARDQSELIHPNAFLPPAQAGNAEASFEIEVNGVTDEVGWINGKVASAILSSLAVFDTRCARSYLDDEGDFAYVPYGLDILEGLAGACKKLKGMVETEYAQSTPDKSAFDDLTGMTEVGKLIATLSHKTKPEQVETLANLAAEETARHAELDKALKETSPTDKAKQLRLRASRIVKIAKNATEKFAIVDDAATGTLRGFAEAYQAAQLAANLAAHKFKEDAYLLPGTGGESWKTLFEAARKFSVEAFPGAVFPELGPNAQCPLCQQPLVEGAERLLRFEAFIQQEVEKTAESRKKILDDAFKVFIGQSVSLGMDTELFAEVETLDKALALDVHAFEKALSDRHAAIASAMASGEWGQIVVMSISPAARLQALADMLNTEAETLEKLTDEKARVELQTQYDELDARIRLAKVKAAVLTAIYRLDRQARLTKCLSDVKTNVISLKASELTEKVVSKELEAALNREFKALGVGNLQVHLKSHADKGKAYHKLTLNLPQAKTPGDILSEGEQRAIAIGSFLAEVNIGGSAGGVVFDDPVSSLDHKRRERVARRLAAEGIKRQVIIFTHDLYFMNLLIEEAQQAGVTIETQSISRHPAGFGVADPDLPFEGMNTKARVGYLKNRHPQIKKLFESGDELEHRKQTADAYRQLRIAWERATEEVLLRNVVLRFRKGIETQRLAGVVVEDADYVAVDNWMSKCSNYAHDQALLGGVEVPDPDELLEDIIALDDWRKETDKRSEALQKKRKSGV